MKYFLPVILIVLVLASCIPKQSVEKKGWGEWEVRRFGEVETWRNGDGDFFTASVPGCIHTDLLANGLIEDPYYGENEKDLQWVGEAEWEYSSFIRAEDIPDKDHVVLVFEGLDTYANVYLNDSLILRADNMFRKWEVDVKDILIDGDNRLSIVFLPPGEINEEKAAELSYKLPDNRAFTRKSPYHFGWDWGPEFVTCGIWKPVYFRAWNDFRIDRVHVTYGSIQQDPIPVKLHFDIESDGDCEVALNLFNEENGEQLALEKINLQEGINHFEIDVEIKDPKLWWPVGMGDQKMYRFRAEVAGNGHMDEAYASIGLREIELIREPDEYGESFYFKVNGYPVFMKGANYIPQDNFLTRVATARYEQLIESVVHANMNMLRVWGGGFYENDIFYDLCDQNGILVWQDFMFACNMYPGDEAFLASVKAEAIENVIRLSNHPCIALWCGNNEIDEGWHNWGWQQALAYSKEDSAKVWNDYLKVFHNILPEAVEIYDPGTIYWPSSPMTGWGRDKAYTQGDVHYWGVWWGEEPFETYRFKIARFMSEYGFQGMPPIETIESFGGISSTQPPAPSPQILEAHQKHPRGTELIRKYMEHEFIVPERFEDYVYVSQVLQAEGMGEAFFTHRISQPYCMGTLYWQLNDCWPVTSWAGLDYYGNWKALHYHVKRAYEPVMVRAIVKDGDILVYSVNDHSSVEEVEMLIELMDFDGKAIIKTEEEIELAPQSNQVIYTIPSHGKNSNNVVFVARLFQDGKEISNTYLYFVPTKELDLQNPNLSFEVLPSESGLIVNISVEKLARQVFLEAPGITGRFEDNFFDMAAGEKRRIKFIGDADTSQLSEKLKIKSIYDTYN